MGHRGDQIGERLARSSAGLDQEVLAFGNGFSHGVHHLDLPRALDPADALHGGVQELVEIRGFRGHCLRLCPTCDAPAPSGADSPRLSAWTGRLERNRFRDGPRHTTFQGGHSGWVRPGGAPGQVDR